MGGRKTTNEKEIDYRPTTNSQISRAPIKREDNKGLVLRSGISWLFLANARWPVFVRIFSLTGVRIPWREDTKDRPSVSEGMLCVGLSPRALEEPTQHSSRDCSFPFFSMVWITNPTMEKERNECPGTKLESHYLFIGVRQANASSTSRGPMKRRFQLYLSLSEGR